METWIKEYENQLARAVLLYPELYVYSVEKVPEVVRRMKGAFAAQTYNKDGYAIKWTCKALNIKWTYKAINHFIANHI